MFERYTFSSACRIAIGVAAAINSADLVLVLYVRQKSFDVLILPPYRFLKALGHIYLVIPLHYCHVATAERPSEFG